MRKGEIGMALKITEDQFQSTVIEAAQALGWKVAHFRPAKTDKGWRTPVQADGKGFPDLVMVRTHDGRIIFAELKSDEGKLSDDQQDWLNSLDATGKVEVFTWRPRDWDEIERILR